MFHLTYFYHCTYRNIVEIVLLYSRFRVECKYFIIEYVTAEYVKFKFNDCYYMYEKQLLIDIAS